VERHVVVLPIKSAFLLRAVAANAFTCGRRAQDVYCPAKHRQWHVSTELDPSRRGAAQRTENAALVALESSTP
jgi:hypothetical protein